MKKIDKLILGSFLGPFFLTFFVVIFILLSQFMLKYIDEIVGKDLDTTVILELIFYFSIFMTPNAFPLAVLLSSLMTFGNLGQHFELTAMKGAGISLIRVLVPIFMFALVLTGVAYYSNNFIVPKANLKAFSLLYDVKQMKPSMELKEGTFYNGIEGYSIKVGKKFQDGKTLKDIIIYDHTDGQGNKHVTMADSGQMYNILKDRYLVLEMFNGKTYIESKSNSRTYVSQQTPDPFIRNEFQSQKVVFSLASFDLTRTKEELFASNRLMKNSYQLKSDTDSMKIEFIDKTEEVKEHSFRFFDYHLQDIVSVYKERARERDAKRRQEELKNELRENPDMEANESELQTLTGSSLAIPDTVPDFQAGAIKSDELAKNMQRNRTADIALKSRESRKAGAGARVLRDSIANLQTMRKADTLAAKADSIPKKPSFEQNIVVLDSILDTRSSKKAAITKSLTNVRFVKNNMTMRSSQLDKLKVELNKYQLERYKKLSYAVTILVMFFIGAPLGAIIKKGGLGIPVLISISFFILFYVISMICEKYTRTDIMDPFVAAWMANFILFPAGLFFMRQAKNDARLFEMDFYSIAFMRLKEYFSSLMRQAPKQTV